MWEYFLLVRVVLIPLALAMMAHFEVVLAMKNLEAENLWVGQRMQKSMLRHPELGQV
jgi:hypothetical protein